MLTFESRQESCSLLSIDEFSNSLCVFVFSYGLLGPSGCGKTTLLRCIIGRLQLNRGEVTVLGERPGARGHQVPGRAVGFMPQETALYKDFSISEMLHYFGHLHNMERREIIENEKFLLDFLDLPSRSHRISDLRLKSDLSNRCSSLSDLHFSGGQQRRLSLACALLQQPRLLILDEPTVGVDPILRERFSHRSIRPERETNVSFAVEESGHI